MPNDTDYRLLLKRLCALHPNYFRVSSEETLLFANFMRHITARGDGLRYQGTILWWIFDQLPADTSIRPIVFVPGVICIVPNESGPDFEGTGPNRATAIVAAYVEWREAVGRGGTL